MDQYDYIIVGAGSAGGTLASARHFISQNGQLQRTTSNTDLGIAGQGFFVVTEKAEGLDNSYSRRYTRAGPSTAASAPVASSSCRRLICGDIGCRAPGG